MSKTNEPIIFDSNISIFVDVDETLVLWDEYLIPGKDKVILTDPYDSKKVVHLKPHVRHIQLMKEHFNKGYKIVVWSAAGSKWAQHVVERLGLQSVVGLVMSKPTKYLDDLPSTEWMGNRVYIKAPK